MLFFLLLLLFTSHCGDLMEDQSTTQAVSVGMMKSSYDFEDDAGESFQPLVGTSELHTQDFEEKKDVSTACVVGGVVSGSLVLGSVASHLALKELLRKEKKRRGGEETTRFQDESLWLVLLAFPATLLWSLFSSEK